MLFVDVVISYDYLLCTYFSTDSFLSCFTSRSYMLSAAMLSVRPSHVIVMQV